MKRFVVVFLTVIMGLSVVAFADEPEVSPADSPSYNSNFEYIKDNTLDNVKETADLVEKTVYAATGDSTRATDYARSIYNGFFDSTSGIFGGSSSSWGSISVTRLGNINSKCGNIQNTCNSINTNILNIMDMINADFATSGSPNQGVSLIDVLQTNANNLLDELSYIDANDDILSIAEILLVLDNNIDTTRSAITNYLSLIDQSTSTTASDIHSYIRPDVRAIETYLNGIFKANIQNITNNLQTLISLYGTSDYEDAKTEQKPYEEQAIEDFTGDGDAAASLSDIGNMKSVSSTIKSGLQSGGSVSNGLAPFSTSSGFWDWFTQSNSDNINSPSSGSEDSRSVPDFYAQYNSRKSLNNAPDVIDFYSGNHDQLMDLFEGNER